MELVGKLRMELRRENPEIQKSKKAEIEKFKVESRNKKMESLKIENIQCLIRGI